MHAIKIGEYYTCAAWNQYLQRFLLQAKSKVCTHYTNN